MVATSIGFYRTDLFKIPNNIDAYQHIVGIIIIMTTLTIGGGFAGIIIQDLFIKRIILTDGIDSTNKLGSIIGCITLAVLLLPISVYFGLTIGSIIGIMIWGILRNILPDYISLSFGWAVGGVVFIQVFVIVGASIGIIIGWIVEYVYKRLKEIIFAT